MCSHATRVAQQSLSAFGIRVRTDAPEKVHTIMVADRIGKARMMARVAAVVALLAAALDSGTGAPGGDQTAAWSTQPVENR